LLVVGPRERAAYDNIDMSIFDTLGDRVIEKAHSRFSESNREQLIIKKFGAR